MINNSNLPLTKVEFGSLLSYSPRLMTDVAKQSRTTRTNLKTNAHIPRFNVTMVEYIADLVKSNFQTLSIAELFHVNPILVPIPKSSLMEPDTLWVPRLLANALNNRGLGRNVVELIHRAIALPKSSTSSSKDRPKALEHCSSLAIQRNLLSEPKEILLVDDVITRGATILGAANRILLAFPYVNIKAFAALRTITPPSEFTNIYDSCIGMITLSGENTFRRP